MNEKSYVAGTAEWNYIGIDEDPPAGKKVHILTDGGMSITGNWNGNSHYLAWSRLSKRNAWKEYLQKLLRQGLIVKSDITSVHIMSHSLTPGDVSEMVESIEKGEIKDELSIECEAYRPRRMQRPSTIALEPTRIFLPPVPELLVYATCSLGALFKGTFFTSEAGIYPVDLNTNT